VSLASQFWWLDIADQAWISMGVGSNSDWSQCGCIFGAKQNGADACYIYSYLVRLYGAEIKEFILERGGSIPPAVARGSLLG